MRLRAPAATHRGRGRSKYRKQGSRPHRHALSLRSVTLRRRADRSPAVVGQTAWRSPGCDRWYPDFGCPGGLAAERVGAAGCSAERRGLPFLFVGSGIEELRREESLEMFRDELVGSTTRWSVRCARSRERLLRFGVPTDRITVAADLAWLIDPMAPAAGQAHLRRLGLPNARPLVAVASATSGSASIATPV